MKRKTTARQTRGRAKSEELDEDEVMELEMEQAMIGDAAFDDDEEAAMLSLAVSESLALSTPRTANEAGPSSSKSRSKAAKLRANAAERRAGKEILSDEESAVMSDASDESNGGGFVNEGKKKSYKPTVGGKKGKMTLSMLKAERREERKLKKAELSDRKKMERAEAKRLGRKLTVAEKTTLALHHHHPELKDVWGNLERTVKPIQPERAEQPDGLKVTLLGFQQESLFWMRKQEKGIWRGGCLADEMGMGKTIQTLALLVSDKRKPNLIIAPTVAVMQWKNEIEAHTNGLKISIFHGAGRETNVKELAKYDVVLTTYSVLESSYRKQKSGFKRKGVMVKEKSPLHSIEWARVVLDEAHNIKERSCNTAKATFELQAKFRWCLSGTPLQNRVGELYSLVRFLGGDPFSYYFCKDCSCKSLHWSFSNKKNCDDCGHSPMKHTCFWNNEILTPIQKHGMQGPGGTAFQKLKILLDRMMLRRTKLERADDLGLPPRTVIVRRDYFSPEEKELYLSLF
ncbi:DNA repair protein rad16, partial [Tulasnella sp. 418]